MVSHCMPLGGGGGTVGVFHEGLHFMSGVIIFLLLL